MVSMQDYMNSIKNRADINQNAYKKSNSLNDKSFTTSSAASLNLNSKTDSFEKEDDKSNTTNDKKIDKKKIFKIVGIIAGIGLAILAFLKRKQISSALSNLFNKKHPPKPPTPPQNPPTSNIPNPKTPPGAPSSTPTIKPVQTSKPVIQGGSKAQPDVKIKPTDDTSKTVQKGVNAASKKIESNPTLSEYTKLCEEFEELRKLDISDPTRKAAAQKLNALEKQMIEQNISFVPKAPESFASDKERWDYLYYRLMGVPVKNEATAIDMLDQFGKLGGKMYDPNTGKDSLMDIGIAALSYLDNDKIDADSANRILQKYIDSVFKFATNEIPTGGYSPDAAELLPRYHNFTQLMTKDTVIKFINAFKNIAVDKKQYKDIKYFLKDGSWQIFYPKLKVEDLPDIQKALDEFAAAVENLPDDIMKV